MQLVDMKDLHQYARHNGYVQGAFNQTSLDFLIAVIVVAEVL